MSVILGFPDNSVKVFVKGADTSMFSVIDKLQSKDIISATETHLHSYSSLGLRTLVIGIRELTPSEFEQWHCAFEEASNALIGRAAMLRKVSSSVENNLCILGASAIEDKLQQGVPESIESLRTAGIKVWVLTGDKQETAISIAYSSKLLTGDMTQIVINSNNRESCRRKLHDALLKSKELMATSGGANNTGESTEPVKPQIALIIDGTSLVYILESENIELEEQVSAVKFDMVSNLQFGFILCAHLSCCC